MDSISGAYERSLADAEGEVTTLILQCTDMGSFHFKDREIRRFEFSDGADTLSVSAWNPAHRFFRTGQWYILSGKLKRHLKEIQLNLLDYSLYDEDLESLDHGRIVPIYPSTEGLSQKRIRQTVHLALSLLKEEGYAYCLPPSILKKKGLADKLSHIETVHFPETREALDEARAALVYEEFFLFQKALAEKSVAEKSGKEKNRYREHSEVDLFLSKIRWTLTESQTRAFEEIKADLISPLAMHRLLHGEVGSGKTLVALLAMLYAAGGGAQAAIMAPTDLLARQHQKTFESFLRPLGREPTFLTSAVKGIERAEALRKIREGEAAIIVGTHSLFQEEVEFLNLGLVVIDEQHRFGVEQRELLRKKGRKVDTLLMSATPIPRTLSLSLFGDLDVSTLRERPVAGGGRKTKILPEKDRSHAYRFLYDRIRRGEQGYVIFPAIMESKKAEMKSLLKEYQSIKNQVFQAIPTGMVHGGVPEEERSRLMNEFAAGRIQVLFATTVLEVGIDHPNATVMVIESADRYGLSQLHQLRGRVGRGEKPGFVYLIAPEGENGRAMHRLKQFAETDDGFAIAELDLELRGPGDFFGEKQSGDLRFRLGDLVRDFRILEEARADAQTQVLAKAKTRE